MVPSLAHANLKWLHPGPFMNVLFNQLYSIVVLTVTHPSQINALRTRSGIDSSYEYEGLTMLHFAAQRLQLPAVEYFLQQDGSLENLNRPSSLNGNSALHFAAEVLNLDFKIKLKFEI